MNWKVAAMVVGLVLTVLLILEVAGRRGFSPVTRAADLLNPPAPAAP